MEEATQPAQYTKKDAVPGWVSHASVSFVDMYGPGPASGVSTTNTGGEHSIKANPQHGQYHK